MQGKIWVIPAERMKAGKEHRVPLTEEALTVLKAANIISNDKLKTANEPASDWVFVGRKVDKHLSNMAMTMLLRRMGYGNITVHGFRSTFRDWVAEQTIFAYEVAESALAHTVGNKVAVAYMRTDLFDKRRKLMEAWARYSFTPSTKKANANNVCVMKR